MALRKGRLPATGRFESRADLCAWIWRQYETKATTADIAAQCRVTPAVVRRIINTGEGRQPPAESRSTLCTCECGTQFTAKLADRERGWARACSKSCAGRQREAKLREEALRANAAETAVLLRGGPAELWIDRMCNLDFLGDQLYGAGDTFQPAFYRAAIYETDVRGGTCNGVVI